MPRTLTALIAVTALGVAGCGQSQAQKTASSIKQYLGAQSVQQIQCTSNGTDGQGNPLQSCNVTFTVNNCQGQVTVQVDGNNVTSESDVMTQGCSQ